MAMRGGQPSPTQKELAEPARRGGVGEGIYICIYNIYRETANGSTRPEATGLGGLVSRVDESSKIEGWEGRE